MGTHTARRAVLLALTLTCPTIAGAATYTQIENAKPGTIEWTITNPGWTSGVIEGYASLTSVNRGGQIRLYVNTAEPSYRMDIFRMGYYGGLGARRMMSTITLPGIAQTTPPPDPVTGTVECHWSNPYILNIPNDSDPTVWMSGVYLVKLTAATSGKQQYIIFAVRDDSRRSDLLFVQPVNTYQAYNVWGGKSLYGTIAGRADTTNMATKVSFDRPYFGESSNGASDFLTTTDREYAMVKFLEREGYDVTYATNVDVERDPNLLLTHDAFLSVGHDEYWSWNMRDNVERARDIGVDLGFFSGNTAYWQVRFESSAVTGEPHRIMVGYKEYCNSLDPVSPVTLRTCRWRDAPVNRREDAMMGVSYITQARPVMVIEDASHWVFSGTGLENGSRLANADGSPFLGYEVDAMGLGSPANTQRLAHSPATPNHANYSDMTVYVAPSGATVFASGSINWSLTVPQVQQVTRNVLSRFIDDAFADTTPVRPPLPSPFQARDIGDVGRPGFVALSGPDSFTLNGAGRSGFTAGTDAMYYAYQPLNGDGEIVVRLTSLQLYWSNRAGVMVRENLTADSKYAALLARPSGSTGAIREGVEFRVKDVLGVKGTIRAVVDLALPNWLKLARSGNTFTSSVSADGVNWVPVGATAVSMNSSAYVGVAVASNQYAVWATAEVDHVRVTAGTPAGDTPLPNDWRHGDIGPVGLAGGAAYDSSSSTFRVTGAGADVWNTSDAFHYAYVAASGDTRIIARVASVQNTAPWTKAGVMIRGSLDPSSAHGFMLVSSAKGLAFQRRTVAGGLSVSTASDMVTAPRWVRLDRIGNAITTYQSADGTSWLRVGAENIGLAPSIHVGLAVSSHTTTATATALFDNVSVTSLATNSGACPSVVLSTTSFYAGAGEANWIINVTAPSATCAWTAVSDSPWLVVKTTVPTPPVGSGAVKVRALANTSGSKRVGHFIIGGVTYTVTQES